MKPKVLLYCALWFFVQLAVGSTEEKWQEYKSSHFIIYYKEAPLDFIKTVEKYAEDEYQTITENLGFTRYENWTWDERAQIYIYDDSEDYVKSAKQMQWSHGTASVKERTIRTFPSAHGFFDSTLPHELGHIIFREFVGFYADVPNWLDEGVAMYQEKAKRWGSDKLVSQAMTDNTFIPLEKLSKMRLTNNTSKEAVDLFYTEAASAVYYLITEFGQHRFVNFCRELKEGKSLELALKSVYVRFENLEEFNQAWVSHLQR